MKRQEKAVMVNSLQNYFTTSSVSFVVGIKSLTVEQLETLRVKLRSEDAKLQVSKVRLMKRAMENEKYAQEYSSYLKDQIALVFSKNEPSSVAKVLCDFAKENALFSVLAGCFDAKVLDKDAVKTIASLPSRQVLLAQLLGTLQAPITGLVCTLNQIPTKLVYALNAIEQSKKSE